MTTLYHDIILPLAPAFIAIAIVVWSNGRERRRRERLRPWENER